MSHQRTNALRNGTLDVVARRAQRVDERLDNLEQLLAVLARRVVEEIPREGANVDDCTLANLVGFLKIKKGGQNNDEKKQREA